MSGNEISKSASPYTALICSSLCCSSCGSLCGSLCGSWLHVSGLVANGYAVRSAVRFAVRRMARVYVPDLNQVRVNELAQKTVDLARRESPALSQESTGGDELALGQGHPGLVEDHLSIGRRSHPYQADKSTEPLDVDARTRREHLDCLRWDRFVTHSSESRVGAAIKSFSEISGYADTTANAFSREISREPVSQRWIVE